VESASGAFEPAALRVAVLVSSGGEFQNRSPGEIPKAARTGFFDNIPSYPAGGGCPGIRDEREEAVIET
jgi:hypothetical protein